MDASGVEQSDLAGINSRGNTLDEELGSRSRSIRLVKQMGSSHDECTSADQVADVAEHQGTLSRVVGNAAEVLQVLCVPEEDSSNYLVANAGAEVFDTGGSKGSALTIASGDNLGRRALRASKVEETDHFSDGCWGGSSRESIVPNGSETPFLP
ncbi:hypothetical protein HG530_001664 [Fusarium avenaceum]|nr:hypothetical protein HG530_001664 [Fusarium avenaceum]